MRVLVFENASTDGSADIAREFCERDPRFSIHPSETLLDMWSNFSRAIHQAAQVGDFFMIRAHDDLSSKNYVSLLRQTLIDHPGAALAVPRVERIYPSDTRHFDFQPELLDLEAMAGQQNARKVIDLPAAWFYGLYRTSAAADIFLSALKNFPYPWGGDRYILMQFLMRGAIAHNDDTTFLCRMGSGNESNYLRPEIIYNYRLRAGYFLGGLRALLQNRHLTASQRLVLARRIFASAPRHTYTSTKQIFRRRFPKT